METDLIKIKSSSVHGLGVFMKIDIPAKTKICDYYGEEMSWRDFTSKYGSYKDNSLNTYPMRRIWKIIVAKEEPYKTLNIVNYINENVTEPNVYLKNRGLYSSREIKKDEELFLVYPKDYKRDWI